MISNDNGDELNAIHAYNNAIKLARETDDQGSVDLLTKILKMEETHVDWAEIQRAQIEQMGLEITWLIRLKVLQAEGKLVTCTKSSSGFTLYPLRFYSRFRLICPWAYH